MSEVLSMGRPLDLARAWERLRAEAPGVRARDAARKLGTSEAELVASACGANAVRLDPNFGALVAGLAALGEVMALTRNEHAVHALRTYDVQALARVRAVLAQASRFDFPLTALEVVLLGRLPHCRGRESERDHDIAAQALSAVDAIDLAERRLPTLSGGERQRVQLARAFAEIWEPTSDAPERFLLLDEPNAGLDLCHEHR
ncbi:MAG: ChuX/HutX family heme-like substrate-binding protein, partial [Gammaproteobacteria bacterium]